MYCVYVLRKAKEYYIGYTGDIRRRLAQHTKTRPGFKLVYYEAYSNPLLARRREKKLKQYGSAWRGLKQRIEPA